MSSPARFALVSRRVAMPDGVRPAAIVIADGKIEAIVDRESTPADMPVEDLASLVVSPGIVDAHVHVNEPGRSDWEGFETATRAAAAGGVTTLVDMPLNSSPATTTVAALEAKRAAAAGQCWIDVGFYGGLIPGNLAHVESLIDAGVCGVKAFLCDSGLDEFPAVGERDLRAALPILARRGMPLLVHAELVDPAVTSVGPIRSYRDWLAARPDRYERDAVVLLRSLCAAYRAPIHVVHLASGPLAALISEAKRQGLPLTVETCPHYLHFAAEDLNTADARFKCAPPIRTQRDRRLLWEALLAGTIDTIGSDHSPCPPAMKRLDEDDWRQAWGGISSMELTLPIVWSGLHAQAAPLERLAQWLSSNPAKIIGLDHRKGRIAVGYDADLCAWDDKQVWTVSGGLLKQRHKLTPYEGERLCGRVVRTYVRGELAYDDGTFPAGPIGALLRRGES